MWIVDLRRGGCQLFLMKHLFKKVLLYLRCFLPMRFKSGTTDYPKASDAIAKGISLLLELGDNFLLDVRIRRRAYWNILEFNKAVVSWKHEGFLVHVKLPSKNYITKEVENGCISIPAEWAIKKIKKNRGVFQVGLEKIDTVAPFLGFICERFYGCGVTTLAVAEIESASGCP